MARKLLSLLLFGTALFVTTIAADGAQAQRRGIPINIESVPPGATVYLDATTGPALGTTPLSNVRVPTGAHTFIFQLANQFKPEQAAAVATLLFVISFVVVLVTTRLILPRATQAEDAS